MVLNGKYIEHVASLETETVSKFNNTVDLTSCSHGSQGVLYVT